MAKEFVTMSAKEIDRAELVRKVLEKRLTQAAASQQMGLSLRQVKRLCRGFKAEGMAGLASRKRGRPSNRKLSASLQVEAVALVRQRYSDFGPKLAHEKLVELHGIRVGRETLRKWLAEAGVWLTRVQRAHRAHQPRHRRHCFGELVQIDGCQHHWFEDRGPPCTLLVYVDDATSRIMELRFVVTESAFDYFEATVAYLQRHGRPIAFTATSTASSESTTRARQVDRVASRSSPVPWPSSMSTSSACMHRGIVIARIGRS